MIIAGLQRVTLLDFPGRVAATLFLAGCNLRCGFCHNRWMIDAAGVTPTMTVEQFLAWLDGRRGLLDGVCVSGGEPTLWGDELAALLVEIKVRGFETKLDTNGSRPALVQRLLDAALLDYVAMDLKAPLDERYETLCGTPVCLGAVRATMALLRARATAYEFRTTAAPELTAPDLHAIAALLNPDEPWFLQPYLETPQVAPDYAGRPHLSAAELAQVAQELRERGVRVSVRGAE